MCSNVYGSNVCNRMIQLMIVSVSEFHFSPNTFISIVHRPYSTFYCATNTHPNVWFQILSVHYTRMTRHAPSMDSLLPAPKLRCHCKRAWKKLRVWPRTRRVFWNAWRIHWNLTRIARHNAMPITPASIRNSIWELGCGGCECIRYPLELLVYIYMSLA